MFTERVKLTRVLGRHQKKLAALQLDIATKSDCDKEAITAEMEVLGKEISQTMEDLEVTAPLSPPSPFSPSLSHQMHHTLHKRRCYSISIQRDPLSKRLSV
jgi:hypothetical protein